VSSYNSSKLDQISTYRLAKESTPGRRGNKLAYKKIHISRPTNVVYIYLTVSIKVYRDTRTKIIYLLMRCGIGIWNEIARSFDFRNIAKTPTVSRLLIDYKGLIELKSSQKTIKFPARSQRSWYMSKSSCLVKIYGITVKSCIKDKSNDNVFMSFNEHCNHCLVLCFLSHL
jgi:hypothetical protein